MCLPSAPQPQEPPRPPPTLADPAVREARLTQGQRIRAARGFASTFSGPAAGILEPGFIARKQLLGQ